MRHERVFAGRPGNLARAGGALVTIPVSGNSPDPVDAVGRAHGLVATGIAGFGGRLGGAVDECPWLGLGVGVRGPIESGRTVLRGPLTTCLVAGRLAPPPA